MIQWHDSGQTSESADGRFKIEEIRPGQWRPIDSRNDYARFVLPSLDDAKAWCEMRIAAPADYDDVQPDMVLIETIDGQTIILPATEAPEF